MLVGLEQHRLALSTSFGDPRTSAIPGQELPKSISHNEQVHLLFLGYFFYNINTSIFIGPCIKFLFSFFLSDSMYSSTTANSERPVRINVLQRSNATSHASSSSQPSTRKSSVKRYPAPTPPSPRDPTKVVLSGKGLKHAHLDRPAVFGIDGRNAGPGRCCIQCVSIKLNFRIPGHDLLV